MATFVPHRRTSFTWWQSALAYALFFGVAWPIAKLLHLLGVWPLLMARAANRNVKRFPDYTPTAHDVFLCSYFKSGSHWLMQIALQITHRGHAEYEHLYDLVAWPDLMPGPREGFAIPVDDETPWRTSPTGLRVIKTHLEYEGLPHSDAARYIALVRDPKSVCVSGFHFVRALGMAPLLSNVEDMIGPFLRGQGPFPAWAVHLASYWRIRARPNVLFLVYEDMSKDLPGTVRKMADFMGVALTAEEADEVCRRSSFAYMKANAAKLQYVKMLPWSKPESATLRKGAAGGSAELLSVEQQQRIDAACEADLERLGCDFPYREKFAAAKPAAHAAA